MSPERNTRLIKNIGTLVTGDLDNPVRQADSIYIADGLIREIGHGLPHPADMVIDAQGLTAIPGLIDSHSHPTFGEFTPAQEAHAWITHYLHGGISALISAGELHLPGLPVPPDPATALSLALLAKRCYDQLRPSGVKVYAGTLLLVPGLKEVAIAMVTGNVARAHGLQIGILEEGKPADLVLLDRVQGSVAKDVLDSFALGDLPGISLVMIDGEIRVAGRSQQTPPPERTALIAGGG